MADDDCVCTMLIVAVDGARQQIRRRQRELHHVLGGALTFVGGIPELDVLIVARADGCAPDGTRQTNALFAQCPDLFGCCEGSLVAGSLVFVGSDADGRAVDVDVAAVEHAIRQMLPA